MKACKLHNLLLFSSSFANPAMANFVSDQLSTIPQEHLYLDGFVGGKAVIKLMEIQLQDGYIGNYPEPLDVRLGPTK